MAFSNLVDNGHILILVPYKAQERMAGTCFRGSGCRNAGNFFQWDSALGVIQNSTVVAEITSTVRDIKETGAFGTHSIEVEFDMTIGWSSTASKEGFSREDLEEFQPNRRSTALRVKTSTSHLAPKVSVLTLVFECRPRKEEDKMGVMVHSIYPGNDIGELGGNITQREGVVFFDWTHPGE